MLPSGIVRVWTTRNAMRSAQRRISRYELNFGGRRRPGRAKIVNVGVRGRYTLTRARFVPYLFAGASWATGTISDPALGDPSYSLAGGTVNLSYLWGGKP